ncbi:hypothetical protein ACR71G_17890 [Xenorhabdus bovienii]|uniref:hypothetical protein n=1 Tax=Xenorhabdus bovienii TaxID=40576 RepID=UPI003DA4D216
MMERYVIGIPPDSDAGYNIWAPDLNLTHLVSDKLVNSGRNTLSFDNLMGLCVRIYRLIRDK